MMKSDTAYRRSPSVEVTTVGERAVLYNRSTGSALVLNPAGTILWQALERQHDRASLVTILARKFPEVDLATIETDVHACLESFSNQHLVHTSQSGDAATDG